MSISSARLSRKFPLVLAAAVAACSFPGTRLRADSPSDGPRARVLIDDNWRFIKGDSPGANDMLQYDVRPAAGGARGRRGAPAAPPPPPVAAPTSVAKAWILPSGNDFLKDAARLAQRPDKNLGEGLSFIAPSFDDASWEQVDLPHDYAIAGPFLTTGGGGMGRLNSSGPVWYRKSLDIGASDAGKSLFLDIDGAMAYAEVWLNGQFVGGWPYGYASFRLNLTPYAKPGQKNSLAIRLDNPPSSSRWYPGAGLYRNVWLTKTDPVHVGQWGTYVTTPEATADSATVALTVAINNDSAQAANVSVASEIYEIDINDKRVGPAVATIAPVTLAVAPGKNASVQTKTTLSKPKLWGTGLHQKPNRYVAVTTVQQNGKIIDAYETPFGARSVKYDPNNGFFLNGEHIKINGVCDHHDLGALGSAINYRALQRQLELLQEMGCNAIRTSHNPPAPELLDLCDKMGFLVMDETFDCWERQKTAYDYHLLFDDWHEQDTRAMLHRDRNHPSIILWSIGNEVGEQGGDPNGIAKMLTDICHQEDPTRPTISAMNSARANAPFAAPIDAIGLNYQGAGLNSRNPQYPVFHQAFPDKFIVGSETTDAYSSRGYYTFPVPTADGGGGRGGAGRGAGGGANGEPAVRQVSSYDMTHASWSYIPDYEFAAQDSFPFVGGEFVWTGFDYLGEPSPYDQSRSSYCGMLDLAGFKKDRFYLYQAYWRPELPMAHILPHWNWPDRIGQVTPVMVYTSGDEAELFLNGKSLGRKKKAEKEYRLRWDDVVYEPGELKVVAYKDGKQWATDDVKTTGNAEKLLLTPDRAAIAVDGKDLSYVTLAVADKDSQMVPRSMNEIHFSISGPGEIVATDNGDATDMTAFPSKDRKAFNGLALAIVRAKKGEAGNIVVTAKADGLKDASATIAAK